MSEGFYTRDVFRTSLDDTWTTPREHFDQWGQEFNFTLDAAALKSSALCVNWYGPDHDDPTRRDAFTRDWQRDSGGGVVWLNPPYGRTIAAWMNKANSEAQRGTTIVCLVPARTDTHWWHDFCIHHEIRFLRGRLKFGKAQNTAPFPSALVVMQPKEQQ